MTNQGSTNAIDRIIEEHHQLLEYLESSGDISLQIRVADAFGKTLLLSIASYFETRITDSVIQVFQDATDHSDALVSFVREKAVNRRYHEWFSWKDRNANHFFSAFGPEFRRFMVEKVRADSNLEESIKAFLEIGDLRNQLAHENYALFKMEKTVEDVFNLYTKAVRFVEGFPRDLQQYITPQHSSNTQ